MSQTSTNPTLKWILIVIAVVTALGAVFVVLYVTYPDDCRAARKLQKRGFKIEYNWYDDNKIWQRPTTVRGEDQSITLDDSRLICQLPHLYELVFWHCDASGLNLDEIGNCQELTWLRFRSLTRFPVNELQKLTTCPVKFVTVELRDVPLKDSDLEVFAKFTHLTSLVLIFNNEGVTDACLEYFEKIPTLKDLQFQGSSITHEGVEEFKKKRPDVEVHYK